MKKRISWRKIWIPFSVILLTGLGAWGVWQMTQSHLFVVKQIEVKMSGFISEKPFPITENEIVTLSAVRVGVERLVNVSLGEVEERLKTQPWIKEVQIWKNFPTTLSIRVILREPVAIIQKEKGLLYYLDRDGRDDLPVDTRIISGLPMISQIKAGEQKELVGEVLEVIKKWNDSELGQLSQLSGIVWSTEAGLKLFANYFLEKDRRWVRTRIDMGQKIDGQTDDPLPQLSIVFQHLIRDSVAAFQIFLAGSKKIVVKTDRRS